ncbi:MAG: type IV pilus modification protein PilV [Rhodanobacteraceae bacterium]
MIYRKQPNSGFSLIEVLIALLVFSLGLIGLAGLLVMSTQANHGAFIRTQATFLAQNLADRMRANPVGLWNGDYDATWPVSGTEPACSSSSPCTPAQVALRDKLVWGRLLAGYLPDDSNLKTVVKCTANSTGLTMSTYYKMQPPYNGICRMDITWTERSLAIGGSASNQTFSWTFQP